MNPPLLNRLAGAANEGQGQDDLRGAAACPHTGVTKPECGCYACGVEQVEKYAPESRDA